MVKGALGSMGADPRKLLNQGYPLPFSTTVRLSGVVLNGADLLVAVLVPVVVIALTTFLHSTALGKSIRATGSRSLTTMLTRFGHERRTLAVAIQGDRTPPSFDVQGSNPPWTVHGR